LGRLFRSKLAPPSGGDQAQVPHHVSPGIDFALVCCVRILTRRIMLVLELCGLYALYAAF
jgi:hypothetical protein